MMLCPIELRPLQREEVGSVAQRQSLQQQRLWGLIPWGGLVRPSVSAARPTVLADVAKPTAALAAKSRILAYTVRAVTNWSLVMRTMSWCSSGVFESHL